MCSGKSLTSRHLANYGFTQVALAKPIKYVSEVLLDSVNGEEASYTYLKDLCGGVIEDSELIVRTILKDTKSLPYTPPKSRERQQHLGTEFRKYVDDEIWIEALTGTLCNSKEKVPYILDDCRFLNEFTLLREKYFSFIKLIVDQDIQIKRIKKLYGEFNPKILEHPSELDVDKMEIPEDHCVDANLPADEMLVNIEKILKLRT